MKPTVLALVVRSLLKDVIGILSGLYQQGEAWLLPMVFVLCLLGLLWFFVMSGHVAAFIYPLL